MISVAVRDKPHAKTDRIIGVRDDKDEEDIYRDFAFSLNSKIRSNEIDLMTPLPISREPTYKGLESKLSEIKDLNRVDTKRLISGMMTDTKGLITEKKELVTESKRTIIESKSLDSKHGEKKEARQMDLKEEKTFAKADLKGNNSHIGHKNEEVSPKSHFVVTKLDMPSMFIESARKFTSPKHLRIMSPELRPKEFSVAPSDTNNEIRNDDWHFKDSDDTKKNTMKISEYLKMKAKVIFKRKLSEKERLFLLSEKRFLKETDICYILEKIQEFEKFKLILLNQDQLQLFNLLAKPLIYLESQKEEFGRKSSHRISRSFEGITSARNDAKKRIAELKKYYQKMTSEKHLSFIDRNLLQLIEDDIFTK